jgi:hypothetical protein
MSDWGATTRVPAEVTLGEGMIIRGDLHLMGRVATHEGPETPLDMLNREQPFFPMSLPNGDVLFVSKAQVATVATGAPTLPDDPDRIQVAKQVGLEVMMRGGTQFRGYSRLELPPTRSRPIDFLNASEPFFAMSVKNFVLYVNRAHIRVARPIN